MRNNKECPMEIITAPPESAVKRLLTQCGLPSADITGQHLATFYGCHAESGLVAVVGLELYGKQALLRSLAVVESHRNTGVGSRLVAHAERQARDQGVESLHLLTTTAETFFQRRGYLRIARDSAPAAIQGTTEFASVCPASAALMVKRLSSPAP
jgi:N-acetylglutamate synthase-like GNAT family acetyltransferase